MQSLSATRDTGHSGPRSSGMGRVLNRRSSGGGGARRVDPKASVLSYRLVRWRMSPLVRAGLRIGLPLVVVLGGTGLWLAPQDNRDQLTTWLQDFRTQIEARPEFRVERVEVRGASERVEPLVRAVLPNDFPVSSLRLDLDAHLAAIVALPQVADASLRVESGALEVSLRERVPAVVWRTSDGLMVLDRSGTNAGAAGARADWPNLPVVAGVGADQAIPELLALAVAARPIAERVRGYERRGARRWDVVLDRNQRIMLPERDAVTALERVVAMHQAQDILERAVSVVDMRLPDRPTLRLPPNLAAPLLQANALLLRSGDN